MKFFPEVGWWLPDHEKHLIEWMVKVGDKLDGRLCYQRKKYRAAQRFVRRFGTAVDIGAHVGLWSWFMAKDFGKVIAFEPMPEHADCWRENMADAANVELHRIALGNRAEDVSIATRTADSSGDTGIEPSGSGISVPMVTLDSFALDGIDLIKMDCEGFEVFVCQGGVETLKRNRPVVIVEQKPETGMAARYGIGTRDAVTLLEGLGARRRKVIAGDYIMSW